MSIVLGMLGALFGLMLLGVPLGHTLSVIGATVMHFHAKLPVWMFIQRFFAGLDSFVLVAIPLFMLSGSLMNTAGLTERLIRLADALVGHMRGGLAQINVVVSMFFGGISGSAVADTAGEGQIIIPAMVKRGYDPSFATAITVASSTLAQIIPPSIIAVIYAATMGVSVGALFLACAIPGLLVGGVQMAMSYIYAVKRDYPREPRATLADFIKALRDSALSMGMPIIILGGVIGGIFTATEASVVAVVYAIIISVFQYKSLKWSDFIQVVRSTAKACSLTAFCIGGASAFGWLMGLFRVNTVVAELLGSLTNSPASVMVFAVVLYLILGTFMDSTPATIVFAPLIAPVAARAGVHPVQLGVVVIITLALGLITPPYGLCLLLGASIAKISVREALRDVLIIGVACLAVVALVIIWPDLVLFLPRLLMPNAGV